MPELELGPVWLSLQLATVTVLVLLVIATPLAWWLAFTRSARAHGRRSRRRDAAGAAADRARLLLARCCSGPAGFIGSAWLSVTDTTLTFSFAGLVVASVIYSFPFAVQPLQAAFEGVGRAPLEAAATLGAGPLDAFWHVASPLALRGYVSAVVLTLRAHDRRVRRRAHGRRQHPRQHEGRSRSRSTSTSRRSSTRKRTCSRRACSCSRSSCCCRCTSLNRRMPLVRDLSRRA